MAPLFLWHFVEGIEHRSSAHLLYNAVVSDRWYRLRVMPRRRRLVRRDATMTVEETA